MAVRTGTSRRQAARKQPARQPDAARADRRLPSLRTAIIAAAAYVVAVIFVLPYLEMLITAVRPQRGDDHLDVRQQEDQRDDVRDQRENDPPAGTGTAPDGTTRRGGRSRDRIGEDRHADTCSRHRVARRNSATSRITSPKLMTDMAADSPM